MGCTDPHPRRNRLNSPRTTAGNWTYKAVPLVTPNNVPFMCVPTWLASEQTLEASRIGLSGWSNTNSSPPEEPNLGVSDAFEETRNSKRSEGFLGTVFYGLLGKKHGEGRLFVAFVVGRVKRNEGPNYFWG